MAVDYWQASTAGVKLCKRRTCTSCHENHENFSHQKSIFNARMHRIQFRLGLRPRHRWESLQHSPRPRSWILGGLVVREEGEGGKEKRNEGGREGKGKGKGSHALSFHHISMSGDHLTIVCVNVYMDLCICTMIMSQYEYTKIKN